MDKKNFRYSKKESSTSLNTKYYLGKKRPGSRADDKKKSGSSGKLRKNGKNCCTINTDDGINGCNKKTSLVHVPRKIKWRNKQLWLKRVQEKDPNIERVPNLEEIEEYGYILSKLIRNGPFSSVHRAHYIQSESRLVHDLICKSFDLTKSPPKNSERFLRTEVKMLLTLDHPLVIKVHSILQGRTCIYIFTTYLERGSLLKWISINGRLNEGHARIWLRQIVDGLSYLHNANIAHRDLRCDNLHLDNSYNIIISDFSSACYTVDSKGRPLLVNDDCGIPAYKAPEVLMKQQYNPKMVDLWSLGVVLFTMLTGNLPFPERDPSTVLHRQKAKSWEMSKDRKHLSNSSFPILRSLLEPDVIIRSNLRKILKMEFVSMRKISTEYGSFSNLAKFVLRRVPDLYSEEENVVNRRFFWHDFGACETTKTTKSRNQATCFIIPHAQLSENIFNNFDLDAFTFTSPSSRSINRKNTPIVLAPVESKDSQK